MSADSVLPMLPVVLLSAGWSSSANVSPGECEGEERTGRKLGLEMPTLRLAAVGKDTVCSWRCGSDWGCWRPKLQSAREYKEGFMPNREWRNSRAVEGDRFRDLAAGHRKGWAGCWWPPHGCCVGGAWANDRFTGVDVRRSLAGGSRRAVARNGLEMDAKDESGKAHASF